MMHETTKGVVYKERLPDGNEEQFSELYEKESNDVVQYIQNKKEATIVWIGFHYRNKFTNRKK